MAIEYFIQVAGLATRIDLAQVEMCVRERVSQASDWLRLQTSERYDEAAQWTPGTAATFYMVDGLAAPVILFRGQFVNPNAYAAWRGQGRRYLIEGPWRRFTRTPFVQAWTAYPVDDEGEPSEATVEMDFARVFLWTDKNTAEQIDEVVDYLIADQSRAGGEELIPLTVGTIDAACDLRPSKAGSMYCSEVVRESLRLLPRAACWFDYANPAPVFHCRNFADLEQVTMPIGQSEGFEATRLSDLAMRYVRIGFMWQVQPPDVDDVTPPKKKVVAEAVAPLGYAGCREGGIDTTLDRVDLWDVENGQALVNFLYAENQTAPWAGRHVLGYVAPDLRPGMRYNVSGSLAEYAAMDGVVQSVVDDFARRTTTVTWGPPRQLGAKSALELLRGLRDPLVAATPDEIEEKRIGSDHYSSDGHEKKDRSSPDEGPQLPPLRAGDGPFWLRLGELGLSWKETTESCSGD